MVEAFVVTFNVELPLPWTGFSVNDPPAPVGRPDTVRVTSFENPPTGTNIEITIAYRDGPGQNKEGTLQPGETVRIRKDMIFDVTATDKS